MINRKHFHWIIAFSLFSFFSCAGPTVSIKKDTVYEPPFVPIEYEYFLGPGDVIEIVYHNTPKPDKREYLLAVGDVIRVEFTYHPEMNRQLTIRPDGKISLPRVGEVEAEGISPSALNKKLTSSFSTVYRDPSITITMLQYNRAIERLKKAITTAPRGQSKLTTIRPDGYISFPLLNDIKASGRTMPQLKKITSQEYSKIINNLSISLILKQMKSNLVYVMGEVKKPNYYLMDGPTMVSQVLAMAGGMLDSAEESTILVLSRDEKNRPVGRIVNMDKIYNEGNISHDIMLRQFDVVFIPKSKIGRADQFVEQYINQIVPDFFKANIGATYRINDDDDD